MRCCIVGYLITHSRLQNELPPISQFGMQFTFQAKQNVTFSTPMISQVARTILHLTHANIIELLCTPLSYSGFTLMLRRRYFRPYRRVEREVFHIHIDLQFKAKYELLTLPHHSCACRQMNVNIIYLSLRDAFSISKAFSFAYANNHYAVFAPRTVERLRNLSQSQKIERD